MAELPERRSTRTKKPVTYFNDQIVQSAELSDTLISTAKPLAKPQAAAKRTVKALAKELAEVPAAKDPAKAPAKVPAKAPAKGPATDPAKAAKAPAKAPRPAKGPLKGCAKGPAKVPAKAPKKAPKKVPKALKSTANPSTEQLDIEQLCGQIEGLDLEEDILRPNNKAKKKAKAEEISRLSKLSLDSIMEEAKDPKDVLFEPFLPGNSREPKVNIPTNIDTSSPLALF